MKILTQLSGGLDSVAVLNELSQQGIYETIYPVFFDYGQVYVKQELRAALYATWFFQRRAPTIVTSLKVGEVPLGVVSTTEVKEYIPMRNLALAAVSVNLAMGLGCSGLAVGSKTLHWRSTDPYSFRDSTASFYAALEGTIKEGQEPGSEPFRIYMPCLGWTKAQVLLALMKSGIDLKKLWSCYEGGVVPCGKCYHCKEIEKAKSSPEVQEWMHRELSL